MTTGSFVIYVDGSSRGNPGPAGIGIAVFRTDSDEEPVSTTSKYIGTTTNNVAEYEALIHALKKASELGGNRVTIKVDSELVYQHISGAYKVRSPHLKIQLRRVQELCARLDHVDFVLIRREENKLANKLAQKASKKMASKKKKISQPPLLDK
jgi:ribonuclease HI